MPDSSPTQHSLTDERREQISLILIEHFRNEGASGEGELRAKFVGLSKRIPELSATTGVPERELASFGWGMVEAMISADEHPPR